MKLSIFEMNNFNENIFPRENKINIFPSIYSKKDLYSYITKLHYICCNVNKYIINYSIWYVSMYTILHLPFYSHNFK